MRDGKNWVVLFFSSLCVAIVFAFGLLLFIVCAGGCSTAIGHRDIGDIRLSDSYILGGIENAVSNFDDGIGRAVRESKGIADEVDRLEFLFNRYEQQALRLRNEVDSLRAKIKDAEKASEGRTVLDSGFYNSADSDIDIKD